VSESKNFRALGTQSWLIRAMVGKMALARIPSRPSSKQLGPLYHRRQPFFSLLQTKECFHEWVFVPNDFFSIQFFIIKSIRMTEFKNLFNQLNWTSIPIQHFCISSNQIIKQFKYLNSKTSNCSTFSNSEMTTRIFNYCQIRVLNLQNFQILSMALNLLYHYYTPQWKLAQFWKDIWEEYSGKSFS